MKKKFDARPVGRIVIHESERGLFEWCVHTDESGFSVDGYLYTRTRAWAKRKAIAACKLLRISIEEEGRHI